MTQPLDPAARIFVAGHRGLVGSAVVRLLETRGFRNLLLRTSAELDLTRQADVEAFFAAEKPEYVVLAAAKVGGIHANSTYPADFIAVNLSIALNVIQAAHAAGVRKLVNLGSSCIYPKLAPQPIPESALLTGPLEPTNEAYALAKIAAIRLCKHYQQQHGDNYVSLMPCNLYGVNDNYHPMNSHVIPGLIRKFHEAKRTGAPPLLWGDGSPLREFLHADDLARAILFVMENVDAVQAGELINVGSGAECTIRELAEAVARTGGWRGDIRWDTSMPNGTPRKLMDSSRIRAMGWKPQITLEQGLTGAWHDFLSRAACG